MLSIPGNSYGNNNVYFSQFIHHILFNVSANQSLYHIAFTLLMPTILNVLVTKTFKMVGISSVKAM